MMQAEAQKREMSKNKCEQAGLVLRINTKYMNI